MATRADVAKLAGVSESTVSYVLSGKRPIGEETRKRVLKAIDKLGYKANYAASALAGGSPRMVTMMTENMFLTPPSQIDGALVDGIVSGVAQSGFHSVIWPISSGDDSDIQALVESNFSGGVILMGVTENDRRARYLHDRGVHFLVIGRTKVEFEYNYVDRDFETVYRNALQILTDAGHTNIGLLSGNSEINPFMKKASASFKVTLVLINSKNSVESGSRVASSIKQNHPKVTAILSLLDLATLGFVNTCADVGISIPEDLSIIGVNMLEEQAENSKVRISTIAFHAYEIAQSCGKLMVEIIKAGKVETTKRSELWVGEYMDRGSISKPRMI